MLYKLSTVTLIMALTTIIKVIMLYFIQGSLGNGLQQSPIVGILGGHAVDIGDAPFMAALESVKPTSNQTEFICGGTIVHEKFVLTAAHCIKYPPGSRFLGNHIVIRVGSSQLYAGKVHQVEKNIPHELYGLKPLWPTWDANYDVGLLKLTEPLTFSASVAMVKLADRHFDITTGLNANVTGWGVTGVTNEASQQLQQLTVTVPPQEDCFNFYDTRRMICITTTNTHGACYGDSGGPLTVGDLQIAIAKRGSACSGWNNWYVKVAPHFKWIQDTIKQNL